MDHLRTSLQQLDDAVLRGSPESRMQALWHTTDLLLAGRYAEDQILVFGEVIERLAAEIEEAARARLAGHLAHTDNAPVQVVSKLALDDSIDVAGPVLQFSERLDVSTLVTAAKSKSQQHLLAISLRKSIDEPVTDVLVERGNQEVAIAVAANTGARLSEFGFLHLVKRCEGDSILAEQLGIRQDIPRHLFQQLIAKASDEAKKRLAKERPDLADQVQTSMADVTGTLQAKFGPASKSYFAAKKAIRAKHQYGNLHEDDIFDYALSHKLEETMIALSLLSSLSVDVVERVLIDRNREMLLVLAKALGFSWETAMALLFLSAPGFRIPMRDLDELRNDFAQLRIQTCESILEFYQARKRPA